MPIGALLGAGASLAGAIMQSNAQQQQTNVSYLNLYEQKRQAREREKLAKATRSDAYGNKVEYIPGQGFVTKTTPTTKAILDAQQKEQLSQFRDDAPRVRQAAERMDRRSRQAGELYEEQFNKYRYGRKRSRAEFEAEAIRDAIAARQGRDKGNDEGLNAISRLALRTGNQQALPGLLKAARGATNQSQTLSEAIANAKKQGRQQYHAETQAEQSTQLGELGSLRSIADAVMQGNMNWNNENAALSGRQDNALSNLIQTNLANSNAVGNAYNTLGQAVGKSPNMGPLASSLSKISFGKGDRASSPQEQQLAELLLQQKLGSAQLGIHRNNAALAAFKGNTGKF